MRGAIFFDVLGWCQKSQRTSKDWSFDVVEKKKLPQHRSFCTSLHTRTVLLMFVSCRSGETDTAWLHHCAQNRKIVKRMLHPNSVAMSFFKCCTFCSPASGCEQHCMHCARMKKLWRHCLDGRWPKLLHSGRKEDTHWWLSWESWSWKQAKRKRKDTLKQTNQEHLDIGQWTGPTLNTKMHGFCVPVHGNMTQKNFFPGLPAISTPCFHRGDDDEVWSRCFCSTCLLIRRLCQFCPFCVPLRPQEGKMADHQMF